MSELIKFTGRAKPRTFDQIRITIASPDHIRSWSHGEVKKPETINYRTFKPERSGLFCARIFGPVKDYECLCGKYRRMKYKGVICEKCGVEVTLAKVRRERMGHIELAAPVAHIWFFKSLPSRIGLLLDMTLKSLERVLYFESHVVVEPGRSEFKAGQLLTPEEHTEAVEEIGEANFTTMIGAEAIKHLLAAIDLDEERKHVRENLKTTNSETQRKKLIRRLKLIELFIDSKIRPEWMILEVVPVLPPDLRPLVPLDGGRFATSDLNDLYRRVINRNNRLKRLIELRAPQIIVRNEKRMLQESVDALFDNGRRGRIVTGANKRPLKSISDMLKGKQGRFRQNLLGKRVDYSGRSVVVVGPDLLLHQCGLPKKMALELFKPFIYSRLEHYAMAPTVKAAKKMVENERPEVWDILAKVIREHPVILNRAPTLHRLGIQAFEPVLVEGKAIKLHPLVCAAFNADFDGDQMAVHVPLSIEAQLEARVLMMSTNNILSPASGKPIIVPSEDIVLGIYYLSLTRKGLVGEGSIFPGISEIRHALHIGALHMHAPIVARWKGLDTDGKKVVKRVDTTAGRMIMADLLPRRPGIDIDLVNRELTSRDITALVDTIYRHCGQKETIIFADRLMKMGFHEACRAGVSIGKDDLVIPKAKDRLIAHAQGQVNKFEGQYLDGLITRGEKYNKIIDVWSHCTEDVAGEMMKAMTPDGKSDVNSIYMMSHSGARGSPAQIKQLAGMRGLMAKPSGEIIETPIISNFKEGLSVLEYFNSTHGARKGLADTALKTANSGYLTRRLVDVAQDCIVHEVDCGTKKGLTISAIIEGGEVIETLSERILGRTSVEDIVDPATSKVIVAKGDLIGEEDVHKIEKSDLHRIDVRSVLTCEAKDGCCAKCYGRDLARGSLVNEGEAVGIIAAQSIGEPGTQLTMRTFHIGGAVQRGAEQSSVVSPFDGVLRIESRNLITNKDGHHIVMNRNCRLIIEVDGRERSSHRVPYGARLSTAEGRKVAKGDILAQWDPHTIPIVTECSGTVRYSDLKSGVSINEVMDEATGIVNKVVIDWKQHAQASSFKPALTVCAKDGTPAVRKNGSSAQYFLPIEAVLSVDNEGLVAAGDILARIPRESTKTRDITGGLPRVVELFEARHPKDYAIISEIAGTIEFSRDYRVKRRILVIPDDKDGNKDPDNAQEYLVPKGRHLAIQEGDRVEKGDALVEGNPVPHDILRVLGVEKLASYLISEVQDVYRLQGVKISDKHIEVMIRQMMRKVEIIDPGETALVAGEQIDARDWEEKNVKAAKEGLKISTSRPILLGITKAALHTKSFISAASFQETTRVLTEAAVSGKIDYLKGLKENVIVGRLIPAGTGAIFSRYRAIAAKRDQKIMEDREKAAALLDAERAAREQEAAESAVGAPGASDPAPVDMASNMPPASDVMPVSVDPDKSDGKSDEAAQS